jgi:hypothetical protein
MLWAFRPTPKSDCVEALLRKGSFEGSLANSVVCAACYVFCQSALMQHKDIRTDEVIVSDLKKKMEGLNDRVTNSDCSSKQVTDELALLKTALYLGDIMLHD